MLFDKPALTNEQLASLLLDRGLSYPCRTRDEEMELIVQRLYNVGYYRLSGYWFPFLKEERFVEGTTFDSIWERYVFDRMLRLLILDAIERVEIYLREAVSNQLSLSSGPFGYAYPQNLPELEEGEFARLLSGFIGNYHRSKELFISHFKSQYGDGHLLPPIWMMVEIIEFGKLVTLYEGMGKSLRTNIAQELGTHPSMLTSRLKTPNDVRNMCCHHARLWNKTLGRRPRIPREWQSTAMGNPQLFSVLTILLHLIPKVAPTSSWPHRLAQLIIDHPSLPLGPMGFRTGWQDDTIWNAALSGEDLAALSERV